MGPVTEGGGGIGVYKKPQNRRQNHSKPQKNWIQTENRMQIPNSKARFFYICRTPNALKRKIRKPQWPPYQT